uniref:ribonuclease P protein subunit p30 n=1 Tax=Myxine glutinosa TaxID=7769 RepID=UPI00358F471B
MVVFMDLNVCAERSARSLIECAAQLGYSAVAINTTIDLQDKKKEIAPPNLPPALLANPPTVQGRSRPIKILTRLTAIISDHSHGNKLKSAMQSYDIVAVMPKGEKVFQMACNDLEVDIICIDTSQRLPFRMRRPLTNLAVQRGIYFEITYAAGLCDTTMRRYLIGNAITLTQICKGRNIIISSAADNSMRLRSPYDVANLALLFGLSEVEGKATVADNCRAVCLHAESRKTLKGVLRTRLVVNPEEEDEQECKPCPRKKSRLK